MNPTRTRWHLFFYRLVSFSLPEICLLPLNSQLCHREVLFQSCEECQGKLTLVPRGAMHPPNGQGLLSGQSALELPNWTGRKSSKVSRRWVYFPKVERRAHLPKNHYCLSNSILCPSKRLSKQALSLVIHYILKVCFSSLKSRNSHVALEMHFTRDKT